MKKLLLFVISFAIILPCFSETIKLKSGKIIEGRIIEKNRQNIKVDIGGFPITYFFDDIETIDGLILNSEKERSNLPQTSALDPETSGIDTENVHKILKHLGYPENTWSAIEKELITFLLKIDFLRLKKEAELAKSDPARLKELSQELGMLFKQEGCLDPSLPHPLLKRLITSFSPDDIFQIIEDSSVPSREKDRLELDIISCSAVSQLGSIVLKLLDINVKSVFSAGHVFNCIPLEDQQVIFVDFSNQVFAVVGLTEYYKLEGKYWIFKEEHRLAPGRILKILQQWLNGDRSASLKEILNIRLYHYIYITDDYTVTPSIYSNYGVVYDDQGNPSQAIANYDKSIEINPDYADSYYNRGNTYRCQGEFSRALLDYDRAIEINPGYAEAYDNRGIVHGHLGNFSQAIDDYTKAIKIDPNAAAVYVNRGVAHFEQKNFSMGISDFTTAIEKDPNLAEAYQNRAIIFGYQENFTEALSDCTKAIEINQNYAQAYRTRAAIYMHQKDFDKAWSDVHKAESLGGKVDLQFLEDLKKASGRED